MNLSVTKKAGLFILLLLFSVGSYAQSGRITLNYRNTPLGTVLKSIEAQTGKSFFYDGELVGDPDAPVTISVKGASIRQVIDRLFNKQLSVTETKQHLVLQKVVTNPAGTAAGSVAQTVANSAQGLPDLRGVVVDDAGKLLAGAVVIVRGIPGKNAITPGDGSFTLSAIPADATLEVSFLGFRTAEVPVNGRTNVRVALALLDTQIERVVVTGYQTVSRERSAGAFSTVDGDRLADRIALSGSILEGLDGLSSGLNINFGEGENKITLRGITSLMSNTAPLFVVDNVPMSAANVEAMVNPNDIEKVSVLKDATATSIWGSQAANGVIVITTRKGRDTDKKLKVGYDGSFNYTGKPDYSYYGYMDSRTFIRNAAEIFNPGYYTWNMVTTQTTGLSGYIPVVYPHELPMYQALDRTIDDTERDRRLEEMASRNNRSQIEDYLLSSRMFTKHSLSVMGGSDNYSFYGSLAYEFNQDNLRNKSNKFAINMRQDFRIARWMNFELTTNISTVDYQNSLTLPKTSINTLLPYMMLRDGEGNNVSHADLLMYKPIREGYEADSRLDLDYVPLDEVGRGFNDRNAFNARLNAGLIVDLFEGLTYEGRFSYQRNNSKSCEFYNERSYFTREEVGMFTKKGDAGAAPTYYLPASGGRYYETNNYENNWTIRNQFNFDREFGNSQVTAIAGMEIQDNRYNTTASNLRGYDPQTLIYASYDEKTLQAGIKGMVIPQSASASTTGNMLRDNMFYATEIETRYVSLYANAAYTYLSKYSLNGSVRVDQSNLFGSDPSVQYKPVWSAGAAWNIKREEFMRQAAWLDRLNLRVSYGLGGNSPDPGRGGAYNIVLATNNSNFAGLGTGYTVLYPANRKLTWERTSTINGGVDFTVFRSVLSGSVDVYRKYTKGLLGDAPMNPVAGWYEALYNIGEMSNKGFEVSLTSRNIRRPGFNWNTTLELSYNKNEIEYIYRTDPLTPANAVGQNNPLGYPSRSIYAYRWAGLDEQYGDPQVYNADGTKVKLTQNLTDVSVARYMGTSQPPWFGSLTNMFRWKDLEFSFMLVYNLGHKMRNDVNRFFTGRLGSNIHGDFDNRWRKAGDHLNTDVPSYEANTATSNARRSLSLYYYADINVLSASYVKLRDVSVYYSLPRRICDKLWAESVKVKFQAANLCYWADNNEGIDPEAFNYGSGTRTTKYGPSFSVGLSISLK